MKRILTLIAMLCASLSFVLGQPEGDLTARLKAHLDYLCSDSLAGRKAGSAEGVMAAKYVASEFHEMGIAPWNEEGYLKPFSSPSVGREFRNVVAKVEGRTNDEYIIIGAHYDHLGVKRGEIYHGADDNASGTAALIELARKFASANYKPRYTILFVAFDAEEIGLLGSTALANLFAERPDKVKLMVSMDMVGWLHDGKLMFQGTGTLKDCEEQLLAAAAKNEIEISTKRFENNPVIATDTEPFAKLGIPTLAITTGISGHYHQPEDTADKIDYQGLARVVGIMYDFLFELDSNVGVVASGKLAPKHRKARGHFDWGATVAIGSSYHDYIGCALVGRPARAWNVGAWAGWSGKHLAMRTSLIYDHRKIPIPSDLNDIWSQGQTLTLHSATLPVEVLLKTAGKTMCAYVGAGGYASYNFGAAVDGQATTLTDRSLREYEFGWQWSIGYRFVNFYIEATRRYALNNAYTIEYPNARNYSSYCTVGIAF